MKKLSVILSLVIASFLFFTTSCGTSSSSSPGEISKKMFKDIEKGDVDAFIALFATKGEEITDKEKAEVTYMLQMMQEEIKKKDGIKTIEILKEDINEAGDRAEVEFKITYGDKDTDVSTYYFVMEDGNWKLPKE